MESLLCSAWASCTIVRRLLDRIAALSKVSFSISSKNQTEEHCQSSLTSRPTERIAGLIGKSTFLVCQDFCFYYMFETNWILQFLGTSKFGGHRKIWGEHEKFVGHCRRISPPCGCRLAYQSTHTNGLFVIFASCRFVNGFQHLTRIYVAGSTYRKSMKYVQKHIFRWK